VLASDRVVGAFLVVVERVGTQYPDILTATDQLASLVSTETVVATADVVTAWAAGLGSPRAVAELEPLFIAAERHLRGRGYPPDAAAEATQRARVGLLTGTISIFTFTGRGALGAFVRVVCVRHALQHARDAKRGVVFDELGATALDPSGPELDLLRHTYREQVDRAMTGAWAQLSRHDRFVLSLHLHAKHSISEIAKVYGIHRINAARKLAGARTALIHATRRLLQGELGVSSTTASSVLRLTSFGLSVGQLPAATDVRIALDRGEAIG
jgi:RNA polymerase sigma-70 factor (ECF subfamily)